MNSSIISLSKKAISLLGIALLWQLVAIQMDPFVLPGPLETMRTVLSYFGDPEFYYAVYRTLLKLLIGMVCVLLLGGCLGLLLGLYPRWKPYLEPVIDIMQSRSPGWASRSFGLGLRICLQFLLSCCPLHRFWWSICTRDLRRSMAN